MRTDSRVRADGRVRTEGGRPAGKGRAIEVGVEPIPESGRACVERMRDEFLGLANAYAAVGAYNAAGAARRMAVELSRFAEGLADLAWPACVEQVGAGKQLVTVSGAPMSADSGAAPVPGPFA